MKIQELKNNTLISNIVKTILDNESFYKNCEIAIKKIYADKKLDSNDIPIILNLLVDTYNNYSTLAIDKQDIKEVFILLFIELIEKLGWKDDIDLDNFVSLVEPQINLLLLSINLNEGCLKKIKNFLCCISTKFELDNESIIPNNIDVNESIEVVSDNILPKNNP